MVAVVQAAGIELKRAGKRHVGLCPFHSDSLPSFYVFPDGGFKCFGCGSHGDVISFVEKFHGVNFKEALQILGIEKGKVIPKKRQEIQRLKWRRELVMGFRKWEKTASADVGILCRCCRQVLGAIQTEGDLDRYGARYHDLALYQYHLDILIEIDDEPKYGLWRSGSYD